MPSERFSDGIALFFFPMFDIPKHSLTLSYKFIKIPPFVKLISDELALFNRCRTQIRRCGKADAGIVRLRRCFVVAVRPARRRGNGIPHPPLLQMGIKWDGFTCGVIALVFLGASYMAEAVRAGILAVPKGQVGAGKAIGLSRFQVFRYVELPQVWAVAVPAIGANILFLMKETSVVSTVGIAELLFVTKDVIGMDYKTNEALFLLFAAYLIILLPVSLLARRIENRVRSAKYGV